MRTDFLVAEIDTLGGDLRRVELLQHKDTWRQGQELRAARGESAEHVYVAQSGLIGEGLANHNTLFSAQPAASYELASGRGHARRPAGGAGDGQRRKVVKTYTFHRGSYVIDVSFEVTNPSSAPIEPYAYFQLVRDTKPPAGDSKMVPTYTGAEVYTEKDKLHKVSFRRHRGEQGEAIRRTATDGWIAIVQHYFLERLAAAARARRASTS